MKKLFYFISMVCLIMFTVSCQLTKKQATSLVTDKILKGELEHIDLFMLNEPQAGTDTILLIDGKKVKLPYATNWVYFIDDVPSGNWAHPCRFIFVNGEDGSYQVVHENFFPANWQTAYIAVSKMPRPSPLDLPASTVETKYRLDPNPNLYAVIINGSETNVRYWFDVSAIYCTLLEAYGYTKENIFVHYVDGSSNYWDPYLDDLDGGGLSDDIDYNAHKGTIRHTFHEMAGVTNTPDEIPELGPEDQLFIFVTGHGKGFEGSSHFYLPDGRLYDYEFASYLEHINCAQIITVLEPCFSGGFVPELTDYVNYDVSCKNRSIHASNTSETSYMECWISGYHYDEFVYYWTAAARGHYPHNDYPWIHSVYKTGSFPFSDPINGPGLITHPGDYNPDTNGDGFVQMGEAFDYANFMDTWSEYGFDSLYNNNWGNYEIPQGKLDISFKEDLLTLSGLTGHITSSQSIENRNYMAGGNLIIDPDAGLRFRNGGNLYFGNETAELRVSRGASLIVGGNVGFYGNKENRIFVDGDIQIGDQVSFNRLGTTGYFGGLYLNNYDMAVSINQASFKMSRLHNYGNRLDIRYSTFDNCDIVYSYRGDVTITNNSNFFNTGLSLENIESSMFFRTATVTDCNLSANYPMPAINIWNYDQFNISNNTIDGYYNGIQLFYSGYGAEKRRTINDNTITNCTHCGILGYGALGNVYKNHITNNGYGVWLADYCSMNLFGYRGAETKNETQEIKDNDLYEVYASQYSFPNFFKYNVIIDDDNHGSRDDPMVYHSEGISSITLKDVKYNCWGVNFDPIEDFFPSTYIWNPVWCPGNAAAAGPDEDMYEAANSLFEAEDYKGAKNMFEMLIEQYPKSKFAKAAVQELFALEKFVSDDYNSLKQYYLNINKNQSDFILKGTADYMVSKCDVKLENWPEAIKYHENIILYPESMEDSIFAIINLGYTYFMMENSVYKSAYTGTMIQYKPKSKEGFIEYRDHLLSLIPGG